jgi:hypothetical protein
LEYGHRLSTVQAQTTMPPSPFFHADSSSVRFWVDVEGQLVGATVGKAALHYRFNPGRQDDDALATYQSHQTEIDDVVRRRVAGGSIEPVMLREHDLKPQPASL